MISFSLNKALYFFYNVNEIFFMRRGRRKLNMFGIIFRFFRKKKSYNQRSILVQSL